MPPDAVACVFLDKGKATDAKLEQLLTWRSPS